MSDKPIAPAWLKSIMATMPKNIKPYKRCRCGGVVYGWTDDLDKPKDERKFRYLVDTDGKEKQRCDNCRVKFENGKEEDSIVAASDSIALDAQFRVYHGIQTGETLLGHRNIQKYSQAGLFSVFTDSASVRKFRIVAYGCYSDPNSNDKPVLKGERITKDMTGKPGYKAGEKGWQS